MPKRNVNQSTVVATVLLLHATLVLAAIAIWGSTPSALPIILLMGVAGAMVSLLLATWSHRQNVSELQKVLARLGYQIPARADSPEELTAKLERRADELQATVGRMESERERLATILSSMTEGVIAIDRNECVLMANQASFAAMDGDPLDPIGRPLRELVRSSQIHNYVRGTLKGEVLDPIECELARSSRIVAVKADLIGGDAPKGAVLTIFDITELRRLERIRREFVANASHELKTPLTIIQACADTLADGALTDPVPAARFLKRIEDQCGRLEELINDMLELGRIESGPTPGDFVPVNIERVLRDCATEREATAAANQLSLTVELTAAATIKSDLTSLRTLIENLADNAIKYTPAGGSVTLELDRDAANAVIRVRDTGIGIEREHINRIFQRFYRVDSARSRASGGSGLGLAICKHLAQQLNGTIDVNSKPGEGSTFTVRLPLD